jgi:hypothetical protein
VPTLLHHVRDVLSVGPEKEAFIRIAARWVVTLVKHVKPGR